MKFQNLKTFSFQVTIIIIPSLINPRITKLFIFHCLCICSISCKPSYSLIMVRFLIIATLWVIWGKCLSKVGAYSCLSVNGATLIRGRCLFETPCLLEEICYLWQNTNRFQKYATFRSQLRILWSNFKFFSYLLLKFSKNKYEEKWEILDY